MKSVIGFIQTSSICFLIIFSCYLSASAQTDICIDLQSTKYVNSLSFAFDDQWVGAPFRFTIFNSEQKTRFQIVEFADECLYGRHPYLFKLDSNYCYNNVEYIYPDESKFAALEVFSGYSWEFNPISLAKTYLLDNGEYFYDIGGSGEVCQPTKVSITGNTGQHGIDPCEHLIIYPSKSKMLPFYSTSNSSLLVASPLNCQWSANSNNDWIALIQGDSNSGPGIIKYSVSENPLEQSRSGSISIGSKLFYVEQEAHRSYLPFIPFFFIKTNKFS